MAKTKKVHTHIGASGWAIILEWASKQPLEKQQVFAGLLDRMLEKDDDGLGDRYLTKKGVEGIIEAFEKGYKKSK